MSSPAEEKSLSAIVRKSIDADEPVPRTLNTVCMLFISRTTTSMASRSPASIATKMSCRRVQSVRMVNQEKHIYVAFTPTSKELSVTWILRKNVVPSCSPVLPVATNENREVFATVRSSMESSPPALENPTPPRPSRTVLSETSTLNGALPLSPS